MSEKKENCTDCSTGYYSIAIYSKTEDTETVDSFVPKDETDMHDYLKNTIGYFFGNYCSTGNTTMVQKMEALKLFNGSPLALSEDKVSLEYHSGTVKYWSVMFDYYICISGLPGTKEAAYMLVHVKWNKT